MANNDKAYFNNDIQTNNSTNHLDEEQNYSSKKESEGGDIMRYGKTISKFLFSHIGLVLMVIAYTCAGSFLFMLLEQHNEAIQCEEGKGEESTKIVNLKSNLLSYIQFNITSTNDPNKDNETVANAKIESWLTDFRDNVLNIKSSYAYDGSDCSSSKWTFPNTLLFTVTVVTTIGYGHISPKTWEGQIVCICYATIGIPLFLMCLANISSVLGDMFRFLYSRVCCRLCLNRKKKSPKAEQKDISTINEAENEKEKTQKSEDDFDGKVDRVGMETAPEWTKNNKKDLANAKQTESDGAKVVDDNEEVENDIKGEDENEKVSVPLTITMIILTGYILIGAILFFEFEKWDLIASAYFCFITLATIGFGDYVPGQNSTSNANTATLQLVVTFVYILLGMSILAMCFDLMQEEIIAKFTWIGKKLGIVEKEDEDIVMENNALNEKNEKLKAEKELPEESNNTKPNSSQYSKKNEPIFVSEKSNFNRNSPAPSYSATATNDQKNYRSNFSNNITQRQPSYIDN